MTLADRPSVAGSPLAAPPNSTPELEQTDAPITTLTNPPKPRLVFRVGVVGHRPDRLPSSYRPELTRQIRLVLEVVQSVVTSFGRNHARWFTEGEPVLRAVSPLAEGTDQVMAETAVGLGFELCCPIPFAKEQYESDFAPGRAIEKDSLTRFQDLHKRAKTCFEMDGDRARADEAYRACGEVVINQSDLLLVVWDGERLGKRGGTEETLDAAVRRGVPIVWFDARSPHHWQSVDAAAAARLGERDPRVTPSPGDHTPALRSAILQALELPTAAARGRARGVTAAPATTIDEFYLERKPKLNHAQAWNSFRRVFGGKPEFGSRKKISGDPSGKTSSDPQHKTSVDRPTRRGRLRAWFVPTDYETAVKPEWPEDRTYAHGRVIDWLRPFYAWSDKLAGNFSDTYRSAFVFTYLLAALAVGMALLPLALGWNVFEAHLNETAFVGLEFLLILAILYIVWRGRRKKWHERWIDYRLAAELLRHLRLSASLGSARPFPNVPAQWVTYGVPAATWMAWYVRAIERDLGLRSARLDATHVRACAKDFAAIMAGQHSYHAKTAERSHRIEKRLHVFGLSLLGTTLLACTAHLFFGFGIVEAHRPALLGSLIFLAGFLPALGAAAAGVSNQGEFRRIEKRSRAMLPRLRDLQTAAESLVRDLESPESGASAPRTSRELVVLADMAAQVMVTEVLDWRVVFLDQPLKPS
jgi:hypothetical protein